MIEIPQHESGRAKLSAFRFQEPMLANSNMKSPYNPFSGLNNSEVLNINILYLETIHALMNQYIISNYKGEYDRALDSLQLLATTMSPKIDTSAEEARIDYIESKLLPRMIIRDKDGNVVRYSPETFGVVRKQMRLVYKSILNKLDSRGMLTFAPKDYKSVLGDFSKA